jgi:branched-chain amino acid transport system substrate-binding protein
MAHHWRNALSLAALGIISSILILSTDCTRSSRPTVRVGVLLPLSGDAAVWGLSMKEGIDLARDQINRERGSTKPAIDLRYEDDRGLPRDGLAGAQKLIEADKVRALAGVANSSVALAIIPLVNSDRLLFVSGGASSPKLSGASKYFFRTWPSDLAEAIAMAQYAINRLSQSRIAILYINNEYGVGLRDPFKKEVEARGGSIVAEETFAQEATDFRTQLLAVERAHPQAIYLVGNPREMARCLKQASELGVKAHFLSTSAFVDNEVLRIAGSAATGVLFTDASFDPNSPYPETQRFISDFKAKYHKDPGMLAVTGYDSLQVLVYALDQGGDAEKEVAAIRSLHAFPGAAGPINFDANGDVSRPVRISTVAGGQFVTKEYLK